jgi:tRNA(Ile)-lysidine synthase
LRQGDDAPAGKEGSSRLLGEIGDLGRTRSAHEHERDALLARYVSLHPAGFALLDPSMMAETSPEMAQRVLSAVTTAIGSAPYPPRRERIARLRAILGETARRGHTLGGCRFIRWRERILVIRELAKAPPSVRVGPGERIVWDRRFEIMVPWAYSGSFTIGYLCFPEVQHHDRRSLQPRREWLPRLLLSILPCVWDEKGIAAVPHLGYRREGVVGVPQIVFRPVNPLTQAGFAVV